MARRSDSRSRMIDTAAELFRRQGYHATAFSEVVRESGAPRGSIYFHFPGGKEELAREAISRAGDEIEEIVEQAASGVDDPVAFVRALGDFVAQRFESSGYQSGCAIATMVLELAPREEALSQEFERTFARWHSALAGRFEHWGFSSERAAAHADVVMAALEGALVLCRAARSLAPLHSTTDALAGIIAAEAGSRPTARTVQAAR